MRYFKTRTLIPFAVYCLVFGLAMVIYTQTSSRTPAPRAGAARCTIIDLDASSETPPKMFETRSQAWKEVGLLRQISPRVVKRARLEALVLLPLFVGVVILYDNRVSLFGTSRTRASRTSRPQGARTGA